jgi:hypothetical protein
MRVIESHFTIASFSQHAFDETAMCFGDNDGADDGAVDDVIVCAEGRKRHDLGSVPSYA